MCGDLKWGVQIQRGQVDMWPREADLEKLKFIVHLFSFWVRFRDFLSTLL
uniref:Uncharacterized protein n=1 Tax=Anguilla anguilla TaxID=7936 RepID=A0A0E9UA62_ANGAN